MAEKKIALLEKKLADAELFSRDPEAFKTTVARLDEARSDKDRLEEEWLELEMKREELAEGRTA